MPGKAELLLIVGADDNVRLLLVPLYCSFTLNVESLNDVTCSPVDFASVD